MDVPTAQPIHPFEKDQIDKAQQTGKSGQIAKTGMPGKSKAIADKQAAPAILNTGTFPILNRQSFQDMRQIILQLNQQKSDFPPALQQAIEKLNQFFNTVPDNMIPELISEKLKQLLKNSGTLFEKKIADLVMRMLREGQTVDSKQLANLSDIRNLIAKDMKPALLLLYRAMMQQQQLEKQTVLKKMLPSFSKFLKHIEQLPPPKITGSGQTAYALTTWIPLPEQRQPVQLKVYYPKRNKETDPSFHLSMLLNMSRIGDLRSDFLLRQNQLQITLFSQEEQTRSLIENQLSAVQKTLEADFQKVTVKSLISKEKIENFEKEDMRSYHDTWIDIKV